MGDLWCSIFPTLTNYVTLLGMGKWVYTPDPRRSSLRIGDIGLWRHFHFVYWESIVPVVVR